MGATSIAMKVMRALSLSLHSGLRYLELKARNPIVIELVSFSRAASMQLAIWAPKVRTQESPQGPRIYSTAATCTHWVLLSRAVGTGSDVAESAACLGKRSAAEGRDPLWLIYGLRGPCPPVFWDHTKYALRGFCIGDYGCLICSSFS